jgi:hypothetical protein
VNNWGILVELVQDLCDRSFTTSARNGFHHVKPHWSDAKGKRSTIKAMRRSEQRMVELLGTAFLGFVILAFLF